MQDTITQFVEELVKEKNLDGLDQEVLSQIKADLNERVENTLNAAIIENLPAEKLEAFEKMLDDNSSAEATQKFCQENVPNLDQVLAAALLDFRRIYLNL